MTTYSAIVGRNAYVYAHTPKEFSAFALTKECGGTFGLSLTLTPS